MAEKKIDKIPEGYKNLGYDTEPVSGPSAPISDETGGEPADLFPEPSAPNYPDANPESISPPVYHETPLKGEQPQRFKAYSPPALVFEDIYEACIEYEKKHSFYGTNFANRMKLKTIDNSVAFQYILENCGEKRETITEFVPYKGETIDGSPLNIWDIAVPCPVYFKETSIKLNVPHATKTENCSRCRGSSNESCPTCHGSGKKSCWLCDGTGKLDNILPCFQCSSTAQVNCSTCKGSTLIKCKKCDGVGKYKQTTCLVVSWQKHTYEFISNAKKLPPDRLRKAEGDVILEEKGEKLFPIVECPDAKVNAASLSLLERAKNEFRNERIVQQRHVLQAIPFTTVTYKWNDKEGDFYVYGKERHVYFEDYPENLSCTCS